MTVEKDREAEKDRKPEAKPEDGKPDASAESLEARREEPRENLRAVVDPEIGISIVEEKDRKPEAKPEDGKPDASTESLEARREELRENLRAVVDPEIGISIVDLGLIYGIDLKDDACTIRMTLTSQGCPVGPQLVASVQHVARKTLNTEKVNVELVWDPPWDPRIHATEDGKFMLGLV